MSVNKTAPDNISNWIPATRNCQVCSVSCSIAHWGSIQYQPCGNHPSYSQCPRRSALLSSAISNACHNETFWVFGSLPHTNPLQFAYKQWGGRCSCVPTVLHLAKSYAWTVFLAFSSVFSTIQPYLMGQKLLNMNLSPKLILWILYFLSNRPPLVRFNCECSIGLNHLSCPGYTIRWTVGAPALREHTVHKILRWHLAHLILMTWFSPQWTNLTSGAEIQRPNHGL